jgi:hypothetical protein
MTLRARWVTLVKPMLTVQSASAAPRLSTTVTLSSAGEPTASARASVGAMHAQPARGRESEEECTGGIATRGSPPTGCV